MSEKSKIPREEALKAIQGALSRIALLHISFSKVIVNELGEKKGKDLIIKSIIEYGDRILGRMKKKLPDLTELGLYEEFGKTKEGIHYVKGCSLVKVFKEQNAMDLGYLYCYVDAARQMSSDSYTKMIHLTCEACGDDDCTFESRQTSEEDRTDFAQRNGSWQKVDSRLFEYSKELAD